jgi:hypothetical protein
MASRAARLSPAPTCACKLTIATPEHNSRIWLNPETPPALNRIALKSVVGPRVPQVVWHVDGEPSSPIRTSRCSGPSRRRARIPVAPAAAAGRVVRDQCRGGVNREWTHGVNIQDLPTDVALNRK